MTGLHLPEETPVTEPDYLRWRVHDELQKHYVIIPDNGGGNALCACGDDVVADHQWQTLCEHGGNVALAIVQPELDQVRSELAATVENLNRAAEDGAKLRAEVERLRPEASDLAVERDLLRAENDELQRKLWVEGQSAEHAEAEVERLLDEVERLRAAVQQALEERDHHSDRADAAESAVERAHQLAERWENALGVDRSYARDLRAALDGPAAGCSAAAQETEPNNQATCCVCGSPAVTYRNYRDQPFCQPCADPCADRPCTGTGCTHEQAHADLIQLEQDLGIHADLPTTTEGDSR